MPVTLITINKFIRLKTHLKLFVVVVGTQLNTTYSFPHPSGPARMKGCLDSSDFNHTENMSKYRFTSGVNITGNLLAEKSSAFKLSGIYK